VAKFNGSELANWELAECMRKSAAYFEEHGYGRMYQKLMDCADELEPPVLKCTYPGCTHDALFRLSADATDELPGRIGYRCEFEPHAVSWLSMNTPHGTVKVDLI
jgi:hypothetical protein